MNSFTVVRGLAAWWVVVFHFKEAINVSSESMLYFIISKGYLAVDLFFLLSGYIISFAYMRSFDRCANGATFVDFVRNRLARIYPLHLLLSFLYISVPFAILCCSSLKEIQSGSFRIDSFLASLLLVHNWGFFDNLDWNGPSWSISTEFFAYVCFALLGTLGLLRLLTKINAVFLVALCFIVLVCVYEYGEVASIGNEIPKFGLIRCLCGFFIGTGIYVILKDHEEKSAAKCIAFLSISLIIFVAYSMFSLMDYVIAAPMFGSLIAALHFSPWLSGDGGESKSRFVGILVRQGTISYSVYLVHELVKRWVIFFSDAIGILVFSIYILIVLLLSELLFRYVEDPCRKYFSKKRVV